MRKIISVSPFRCRMWSLHDRLEDYVTEDSCREEIESFSKQGQLIPALGRRVCGDPCCDVELIYGARRWFVTRHLNLPLLVEIREMTDAEAIVAMDIENRQRRDITPYERGMSYARWLGAGYFKSQEEIARALRLSASQVSRVLRMASLPAVVVDAFASPRDIREIWGLHLMEALEDVARRESTLRAARSIRLEKPRPRAEDVYQRLITPTPGRRSIQLRKHDDVVKDIGGTSLFRIRRQRNSLAFVVPLERVSAASLAQIRDILTRVLTEGATSLSGQKHDSHATERRPVMLAN